MKHLWVRILLIGMALQLAGCVSAPPSRPDDVCDIFKERSSWYKAAKQSQEKWGVPIPVMMATIHQESRFVADARPPRTRILWVFPGPRASDAYGYPQAKDDSWDTYEKNTRQSGSRDDFADAIDFVGWYYNQSYLRNRIPKSDAYNLYLSYHEGNGGYSRKTYEAKPWLKAVATKVKVKAQQYSGQLIGCVADLESELNSWF